MVNEKRKKDIWDKMSAITPLLIGLLLTGVGAIFTHVYNYRQLQLNQIEALEKIRPLLTAENPQEREFAYSSFVALGYEDLAIRLIEIQQDQMGRSVLIQLKDTGPAKTREKAVAALVVLDDAQKLVNIAEFGRSEGDKQVLEDPNLAILFNKARAWAQDAALELGISSKLGLAILLDAAFHHGLSKQARSFNEEASQVISPPLDTLEKEKAWLIKHLDAREELLLSSPNVKFHAAFKKRIDRLRSLIENGDWELLSIE